MPQSQTTWWLPAHISEFAKRSSNQDPNWQCVSTFSILLPHQIFVQQVAASWRWHFNLNCKTDWRGVSKYSWYSRFLTIYSDQLESFLPTYQMASDKSQHPPICHGVVISLPHEESSQSPLSAGLSCTIHTEYVWTVNWHISCKSQIYLLEYEQLKSLLLRHTWRPWAQRARQSERS